MQIIADFSEKIYRLCKSHHVRHLYAFGSVLNQKFNAESDIDLIVDFEKIDINLYADNYYNLKFSLEDLFKRKVDLLENQSIRNPIFKSKVEKEKQLIYG